MDAKWMDSTRRECERAGYQVAARPVRHKGQPYQELRSDFARGGCALPTILCTRKNKEPFRVTNSLTALLRQRLCIRHSIRPIALLRKLPNVLSSQP